MIGRQKLPAIILCLGETPVSCCCCSFIFVLHFVVLSSFHFSSSFYCCSSFFDVLHSHLLLDIITHPSVDYRRVLTPILYFQPSPSQSDSRLFHFQPFLYLLTTSARVLGGIFYPQVFFTLRSFTNILATLIKASLAGGRSSLRFAGLDTDPQNRPGPSVCLIHSNAQSSYSEQFIFKFYHILSWISCGKSLIYLLLTRFELLSLVQSNDY